LNLKFPSVSEEDYKNHHVSAHHDSNHLIVQMTSKDPSIQLAMALSASLQEAQEAALIEETSNLFEAGLESEAMECCKTLQTLPMLQPGPSTSNKGI
jgi:hypothetical protein